MSKDKLLHNSKLYVLISSNIAVRPVKETTEQVIKGGADVIQLREKTISDSDFIILAREIRTITNEYSNKLRLAPPLLIINDRVNVAREVDADGVHLGQDDISIIEAREIIGNGKIIGISTHTVSQAVQAQKDGADYIAIGPIYPTRTKSLEPAIGPEIIKEITKVITIPLFAIGAITLESIDEVLAAGATRVAICSAIISSSDIILTAKQFKDKLANGVTLKG